MCVLVDAGKMNLLVTFFVYEVSREVMVKFHQKPFLYMNV
jgi:hypothetical protein